MFQEQEENLKEAARNTIIRIFGGEINVEKTLVVLKINAEIMPFFIPGNKLTIPHHFGEEGEKIVRAIESLFTNTSLSGSARKDHLSKIQSLKSLCRDLQGKNEISSLLSKWVVHLEQELSLSGEKPKPAHAAGIFKDSFRSGYGSIQERDDLPASPFSKKGS